MPELFSRWKWKARHRKQQQHWRKYKSGRHILINIGIRYKQASELDKLIKFNRGKLLLINKRLLAYQGLLKRTSSLKERDLIESYIGILKEKQKEIDAHTRELQNERFLLSLNK